MTVVPPSEPDLSIDVDALNTLLAQCETESRHPSDEELSAIGISPRAMARIAATTPMPGYTMRASSWYHSVFVPMGFVSEEHKENITNLYEGLISVEDFVNTLTNEEADIFVKQFPELNERYARRINRNFN